MTETLGPEAVVALSLTLVFCFSPGEAADVGEGVGSGVNFGSFLSSVSSSTTVGVTALETGGFVAGTGGRATLLRSMSIACEEDEAETEAGGDVAGGDGLAEG